MTFTLSCATIKNGDILPKAQVYDQGDYGGQNRSPALKWENAPEGTKSFALSVYDPDAPTGSGFWHWYVINLSADTTELAEDAGNPNAANMPKSVRQMNNDIAEPGFVGAFPPKGDKPHRYIFTVYALGVERLDLPDNATTAFAGFNVKANAIGEASFTAYYQHV
ncbi:MAG: YbhB/YbcL family Raf kinase inhibitor-like protein [Gammaproteobacteria bacterium]|nr:MAG: YbhB/YbcL family Raf kinase inhibitor-like protein [Gammaproteobacteria bacterium]